MCTENPLKAENKGVTAMLKRNTSYKVDGYTNKWSVIDTYKGYALLENETYGDETCYLLVRKDVEVQNLQYTKRSTGEKVLLPTIMEVITETFDDIETAINEL